MPDYSKGKIYCITCNISNKKYYGSTCSSLMKRKDNHIQHYKYYLKGKINFVTSFDIIKNNNFKIELIEEVNCLSKNELLIREKFFIENNDCVNKYVPLQTDHEYYIKNKEKHNKRGKEYYENNKNHLKEKMKEWIEKNKDTEHYKEIKKLNKLKQKELHGTITCSCGSILKNFTWDIKRHEKSLKHISYIQSLN